MSDDILVRLRLSADGSGLVGVTRGAREEIVALGRAGQSAGNQVASGAAEAERRMSSVGNAAASVRRTMLSWVGGFSAAAMVRELIQAADTWSSLNSRIRLATRSEQEYARAREGVFAISQRTSAQLAATASLYARVQKSIDALGGSQAQALALTEAINQSFVVSGASASESSASIQQLSQALASGVLRGDEFNSVMENSPRLADALSAALGKSRGQLRAMAEEGQLTSSMVVRALLDQRDEIERDFTQMPLTIGRAWQQVQNAVLRYVGEADQATGTSTRFAQSLKAIADNIGPIADTLVQLGEIALVMYAAKLVRAGAAAATAMRATTVGLAGAKASVLSLGTALNVVQAAFVGWQIGTWARERFQEVRIAAAYFVDSTLVGWERIKQGAQIAWAYLKASWVGTLNYMREGLAGFVGQWARTYELLPDAVGGKIAAQMREWEAAIRPTTNATDELVATLIDVNITTATNIARIRGVTNELINYEYANEGAANAQKQVTGSGDDTTNSLNNTGDAASGAKEKLRLYVDTLKGVESAHNAFTNLQQKLAAQMGGASVEAANSYADALSIIDLYERKLLQLGPATIGDLEEIAQARKNAADALERETYFAQHQLRAHEQFLQGQADEIASLGMTNEQREISNALRQAEQALLQERIPLESEQGQAVLRTAEAQARAIIQTRKATEETRAYQDVIRSGLTDAFRAVVNGGGNVMRKLVDIARDVVKQIILVFFQLRVIEPLMQRLFSGGGFSLAGIASAFTGSGGVTGGLLSAFGLGGSGQGSGGFSPLTLLGGQGTNGLGQVTGLFTGSSSLVPAFGGGYVYANPTAVGPPIQGFTAANPYGLTSGQMLGGFGTAVAGLGGAYYGYNRTNGGIAGVGAAATYGALGIGVAGTAAGVAGGLGVGAAAGGAFSALGASAAIPVVGWALAALAVIDFATGGKIFGTKFKPKSFEQGFNIGPDGAEAFLRVNETRQAALFGGTRRRTRDLDAGAEAQSQADQMRRAAVGAADQVGALFDVAGRVVAGSFTRVMDKKGKTVKDEYSTFFGVKYKENAEAFTKRVVAESMIGTLDDALGPSHQLAQQAGATIADALVDGMREGMETTTATVGNEAHQIAERWRANADELLAGAQFLVAAADDMRKARGLLGEQATLTQVTDLVEDLRTGSESLIDTYTRVRGATELLDQALKLSGQSLDKTREETVRLAVDIADAAGGLDAAGKLWGRFFEGFYSATERGNRTLEQSISARDQLAGTIGVDANISSTAFRELFEQKLPSLTAQQIVQWLQFGDALLTVVEATANARQMLQQIAVETDGTPLSQYQQRLVQITTTTATAINAADQLARSRGEEGASAQDLALIHRWTANQVRAAIAELKSQTNSLMQQLGYDRLSEINSRIEALGGNVQGTIEDAAGAAGDFFEQMQDGLKGLQDYLDSMLLGDLSALSPEAQIAEARRQLTETAAAANRGDVTAIQQLPQLADAFLRLSREFNASGADYGADFDWVRNLLRGVSPSAAPPGGAPGTVQLVPSEELRALYAERDEITSQQEAAQRLALAAQLAQNLRELSAALGQPVLELASQMGIDLSRFVSDLGVNIDTMSADVVGQLAGVANTLGIELPELADALNVQLGNLADSQSLINDAFEAALGTLPQSLREQLEPAFHDLESAADTASTETALARLNAITATLPEEFRLQLAPYLDGVDPLTANALSELDHLASVDDGMNSAVRLLGNILATLRGETPQDQIDTQSLGPGGKLPVRGGRNGIVVEAQYGGPSSTPVASQGEVALIDEVRALRAEVADLKAALRDVVRVSGERVAEAVGEAGRDTVRAVEKQTTELRTATKRSNWG